jgi:hypothetical protein
MDTSARKIRKKWGKKIKKGNSGRESRREVEGK